MAFSSRHTYIGRVLVFAGFAAILAACGPDASNSTIGTAQLAANNSSTPTGVSLPIDFTASLIDGSPITLHEKLAQGPVALWFWAPG